MIYEIHNVLAHLEKSRHNVVYIHQTQKITPKQSTEYSTNADV